LSGSAIHLRGAGFTYAGAGTAAVAGLNVTIEPGQFVVLAGAAGSGKTTVTRLLNGLIPHYYEGELAGQVEVGGLEPAATHLWELPVGSVFQNPRAQFFTTDTTSEVAFGAENLGLPAAEIRDRVERALTSFGLEALRDRSVFALSGGEKQRLACAAVAAAEPPVYVLDEPSANLDEASTDQLRRIMAAWKAAGATVVVAEHRLGYLRRLADRVLVFKAGRIAVELTGRGFRGASDEVLRGYGLRRADADEFMPATAAPADGPGYTVDDLVVRHRRRLVPGVWPEAEAPTVAVPRLEFPKGQVTAVIGPNGAGKTTLFHWLAGLIPSRRGRLLDAGAELSRAERRKQVFLVLQDVNHQLFTASVADEIGLALRLRRLDAAVVDVETQGTLDRLDLAGVARRHPLSLSAGERQRVAIATALASGRDLIALDEPTSGLDLGHMEAVARALIDAAARGRTVLVATHDAELVAACADQVVELPGTLRPGTGPFPQKT
jgi:energy-coupling factor transport system ATP-binding protein